MLLIDCFIWIHAINLLLFYIQKKYLHLWIQTFYLDFYFNRNLSMNL